jgi:hypothetical protein
VVEIFLYTLIRNNGFAAEQNGSVNGNVIVGRIDLVGYVNQTVDTNVVERVDDVGGAGA